MFRLIAKRKIKVMGNINQNMTTAHRPTWNSARGSEQGGNNLVVPKRSYSALDMPAHVKLKERREG
jgi:hypothetical protein